MQPRRIRQSPGLVTDVSPLDAPEGALRQADDVLLHRPGLIVPRPGFGDTTGVGSRSTAYRPIAIWPFGGAAVVQSKSGSSYRIELLSADTQIDTANVTPPDTALRGRSDAMLSRGSLYLTTDTGVRKVESLSSTSTAAAGIASNYHAPSSTTFTTTGLDRYAIAADNAVAYRYVFVSEDANGYVRRSAPSSRWEVASAYDCTVRFGRVYLPSGLSDGDKIELYRTQGSGAAATTPGGDYYLATTYRINSADISNGYIAADSLTDTTRDGLLGAALYTSNSQGGAIAAKYPPPLCNSLAEWQGCGWYGNTRERNTAPLRIVSVYDSGNAGNDITGLHHSSRTGTVAGGTAMTAVSGVDGLRVDQYVSDSGTPLAAGTYIGIGNTVLKIEAHITITHGSLTGGGSSVTIFGQTFTFENSPSAPSDVQIGINATEDATNLAAVLDGWDFSTTIGYPLSTSAASASDVCTLEEDNGNGPEVTIAGGGLAVAYEVTLKNASTGSGTAAFEFHDAITIDGVQFYTAADGGGAKLTATRSVSGLAQLFGVRTTTAGSETTYDSAVSTAQQLADAVNCYGVVTDATWGVRALWDGSGAEILLLRTEPSDGTIDMKATPRGEAYVPKLDKSSTLVGEDSRRRGRVYWSLPQEPEAVRLVDYADVGRSDADVLSLVALDSALIVFKEDGIYRVSGYPPSSWSVDELRAGLDAPRLLAPDAVCVMDGVCYAWTDRGVLAVTEAGIAAEPISRAIGDQLRPYQALLPRDNADAARGFYMTAHPRLGLVTLAVAAAADDEYSEAWFVWARSTGAWSKWTRADRCAAYDPAEDRMIVSPSWDSWTALYERSAEATAASYRDESAALGSEYQTNGVMTVAKSLIPWTPTTCDVVQTAEDGSTYYPVLAVASNGANWDITISTASTNDIGVSVGSATLHQGIAATMLWQPQHGGGMGHRWAELHAEFAGCSAAYLSTIPVELGGAAHRDASPSSVTATITPTVTYSAPVRAGLPRECVRTPHLYPYARICTAGALWELSHVYAYGYPTSQRSAR